MGKEKRQIKIKAKPTGVMFASNNLWKKIKIKIEKVYIPQKRLLKNGNEKKDCIFFSPSSTP